MLYRLITVCFYWVIKSCKYAKHGLKAQQITAQGNALWSLTTKVNSYTFTYLYLPIIRQTSSSVRANGPECSNFSVDMAAAKCPASSGDAPRERIYK